MPLVAPGNRVCVVAGPAELRSKRLGDIVDMEDGVEPIPPKDLEGGQLSTTGVLCEVGEADLTLLTLSVGRDEEQILRVPTRAVGPVGRGPFLKDERAQDPAEGHDGESPRLELDEEHAPRLAHG